MKKYSPLFCLSAVLLCLALVSFKGETVVSARSAMFVPAGDSSRTIIINNQYSVVLRNHMVQAYDLNDEASLQYNDIYKELYIIVIDEPSNDFMKAFIEVGDWDSTMSVVENYRRVQIQSFKESINMTAAPQVKKTFAGKSPMEIVEFTGLVDGIEEAISYKIGFIEADKNLYMIMTWTLASMEVGHRPEMFEMLRSFRSVKK
jgi:hypothetical protein